ncbi:MAG TPA: glycosyltransferase [Chitinophagaceae bacterium]|nr:glycosyltransferase [Chitinophagaceae bacterium]
MNKKKIHFWVPYPQRSAPSQRFRVEQYLPYLPQNSFSCTVLSFLDATTWSILYKKGYRIKKFWGMIMGFFRRIGHLFKSAGADYVFILREASPVGPPVFEWLLSKIFRKKIIYDFDDAIWIPGGEKTSWRKRFFKSTWKIKYIIHWAYKVSCGNQFLLSYARKFNPNVILLPTGFDTERSKGKQKKEGDGKKVVVGWTGSHTTLHNLEEIEQVISELKKEMDFDFYIISNSSPAWDFDFIFKKWNEATEIDDLLIMDIGVMPLKQGPWFEGKCGFKLIQYHAFGIPAVASPVGVNMAVTIHTETGFIAQSPLEWKNYLKQLISEVHLRSRMGEAGKEHIEKNYSLNKLLPVFVSLFS